MKLTMTRSVSCFVTRIVHSIMRKHKYLCLLLCDPTGLEDEKAAVLLLQPAFLRQAGRAGLRGRTATDITSSAVLDRVNTAREARRPDLGHRLLCFVRGKGQSSQPERGTQCRSSRFEIVSLLISCQLKALRHRLMESKGVAVRDASILWALRSQAAKGDADTAYLLLLAMSDASEGLISNFDPAVRLRGAQNRQGVTCYLDATLFSMFSRLDSFEAMLYNSFADLPRKKLSFLLRLWVNMLRTGQLITVDITQIIQIAIADCGWDEAALLHQQDASEAFTFITGKLDLPLLTLKMDIYHTGREDENDDHKFINERLLDVAIPEDPTGNRKDITLEECLEEYFNNRVEVRRYLERRSTLTSMKSPIEGKGKNDSIHVETVEIDPESSPSTPSGLSPYKTSSRPPARSRTQSIIQERYIPSRGDSGVSSLANVNTKDSQRSRAGSLRKEVLMPAWQFFSLIPWYTDNAPSNDAQVAAHFSTKRPVLGLCLKRYAIHAGRTVRLNTHVDVPVEIGLPHFIQDDHMSSDGTTFGNFKLSLQSVVCHRGYSVDSGHYVALVRSTARPNSGDSDHWLRFDDLAPQRITLVDIQKALREETPYLLFYQIMPVEGDLGHITEGESLPSSTIPGTSSMTSLPLSKVSTANEASSGRPSFEISPFDDTRGRSITEERRKSLISFSDQGLLKPSSSSESPKAESRRGSTDLARTASKSNEGLGRTLSRLARRKSRETAPLPDEAPAKFHVKEVPAVVRSELPAYQESQALRSQQPKLQPPAQITHRPQGHGHRRDRSKGRLKKHNGKSKELDRECLVM